MLVNSHLYNPHHHTIPTTTTTTAATVPACGFQASPPWFRSWRLRVKEKLMSQIVKSLCFWWLLVGYGWLLLIIVGCSCWGSLVVHGWSCCLVIAASCWLLKVVICCYTLLLVHIEGDLAKLWLYSCVGLLIPKGSVTILSFITANDQSMIYYWLLSSPFVNQLVQQPIIDHCW